MRRGLFGLMGAALAVAANLAEAAPPALHVMLTNDDGYQAAGLMAVHAALQEAGFRVTVVAPLNQQSGSGVRLTLGQIVVKAHGDDIWSVDGSPADSAAYGLSRVLATERPDVVVSGANLGQNLGANAVSSGTVGAAVMAVQLGVPAIAVSVGLDLAEAKAAPTPFPSTVAAYPLAGKFVAQLITRLAQAAQGGPLLPPDTIINVNLPARPAAAMQGVRLAPLGRQEDVVKVIARAATGRRADGSIGRAFDHEDEGSWATHEPSGSREVERPERAGLGRGGFDEAL